MITLRTALATVPILLAVGVISAVGATAAPPPVANAKLPHILEFEYFEDYERIGRRYNAFATLKGEGESGELRGSANARRMLGSTAVPE